ncbi:filamentous hemagglutinin N-terminal domain-containing protein [Caulobacter soli]|uniref:two-partner secretion domain-containing protein n=1 Tax=Caulobacter soli TaxID=2708539 RepID=UPI0013ECF769|nr:filamentous hemagglutinin N-terminal domain-containing protein [Caulobacter soli]
MPRAFPMTSAAQTSPSDRRTWLAASTALAGLAMSMTLGLSAQAQSLPSGGTVSAGQASFSGDANTLTINQASAFAAINWQSFNIGQGQSVTFVQPGSQSVALNRVLGADPSQILGALSANGKVFLVNPNGVLFGQNAQVNVAGLVASTLDISDADFMAGNYRFSGGGGAVLNQGTIKADGGFVALLGANVSNQGLIQANLGTVVLAAGSAITLDVAGDGLLNVTIDQGAVNALATNGGLLRANGGQVVMTASSAGQLIRTAVNTTGVIEARALDTRNGVIRLIGDPQSGGVAVNGGLDVTGAAAGQTGGDIVITGQTVSLGGQARLDASGDAGGGTVLVGGDYQGGGALAHADTVSMARGAVILANAGRAGQGGEVVLWSDGVTQVDGAIGARGGALSGDGGLVETSGKRVVLGQNARVDTLAPRGATGLWLLDPVDYTIAIASGDETPSQVTISLASSNRLIEATHDITVADAVTWTTPQTLELRAGNDVLINAAVTASTAGSLMRLTAGRDVLVNGALTASGNGSLIEINSGRDIDLHEAVTASGGGALLFRADNDGTGGPTGGTVRLDPLFPVTSTSKTIYYSPENGYAAPNLYTGFTAYMWVFVDAIDKVYDGTVAATATFRGDPTVGGANDVGLAGGAISFVDKNVGPAKPVTFAGYGINGADVADFALFAPAGDTTAAITPAVLTITANDANKVYGHTVTLPGTAFTSTGLVAGETIGGVTEVSPGAVASATVAGSPYVITPSDAVGGTFLISNYTTNYVNGALTVTPAALTVRANDASKPYGQTLVFVPTTFTTTGLVNGDTIAGVTQSSPGATAGAASGPYVITTRAATGGSYIPANYVITYGDGALTVLADATPPTSTAFGAASPIVASPSGVPAGVTRPGDTSVDAFSTDDASGASASGASGLTASNGPLATRLTVLENGVRTPRQLETLATSPNEATDRRLVDAIDDRAPNTRAPAPVLAPAPTPALTPTTRYAPKQDRN